MAPGRRVTLIVVALSLLFPTAIAVAPSDALADRGFDVAEGDGFLHATRGDGPVVVAVGDPAHDVVLDAIPRTGDATVALVEPGHLGTWARTVPVDGPAILVVGTPDGDAIARDLTSEIVAPEATDRLWQRGRDLGIARLSDDVAGPHPAGRTLADAGIDPVVLDLGDGPVDAAAADDASRLVHGSIADGFAFHALDDPLPGGGDGDAPDLDRSQARGEFEIGDLLTADFWLQPRWSWDAAGFTLEINLAQATVGATALVGLAGMGLGVKHVTPDNALENDSRAALYDTISTQPGIHLRELARSEDMNITSASWHIKKLEDVGLVRSQKLEGYKVFYPSDGGREAQRVGVAMNVLRNDNADRLLHHIADRPGSYQRQIADALDLNHATVRWHLKKLKSAGLVTEVPLSHVTQYYVSAEGLHALHIVDGDVDTDGGGPDPADAADDEARAAEGQAS